MPPRQPALRIVPLDATHKLTSTGEFTGAERYGIDNTSLTPLAAARLIADAFGLTRSEQTV
jgi:hypothetical protein